MNEEEKSCAVADRQPMTTRPDEHEERAKALVAEVVRLWRGFGDGEARRVAVAALRQAAAEERARIVATVHSHALKAAAMSVANGGDEDGKSYAAQRAHHALAIEELIRLAHHATPAAETKSAEAGTCGRRRGTGSNCARYPIEGCPDCNGTGKARDGAGETTGTRTVGEQSK